MTHPKTLAVIRVFSSTDQKVLEKHAKIIEKLYGIPTRTYCIPNQPEGIANEEIAKDCVDRIVEQCLRAEKDGADAVLVSCAIDPGVEAARKVCRIPVFGAGSCAAAMALISLPINYFIVYPAYVVLYGLPLEAIVGMYQEILGTVAQVPTSNALLNCLMVFNVPFTLCKGLLDVALCFLIYKPLSPLLHK